MSGDGIIRGTPSITLSREEPLKVGDEFIFAVNLGDLSGDLSSIKEPLTVWIAVSDHFEIMGERMQYVSADDLRNGSREIAFLIKMIRGGRKGVLAAYFTYAGRRSGGITHNPVLIP